MRATNTSQANIPAIGEGAEEEKSTIKNLAAGHQEQRFSNVNVSQYSAFAESFDDKDKLLHQNDNHASSFKKDAGRSRKKQDAESVLLKEISSGLRKENERQSDCSKQLLSKE